MRKLFILGSSVVLAAASAFAQTPSIGTGGVLPSATYIPEGLPSSGIAQGSFFTIFGINMGPAAGAGLTGGTAIPTTLGGTSVTVTSGGTSTGALLFFVSPMQINAVMPSTVPTGAATVTVTANNATSAPAPIQVVASSFGSFTQNSAGTGPADALIITQGYKLNTLIQTAIPGVDYLALFGTGLGPVPGGDQITSGTGIGTVAQNNLLPNANFHLYVGGVDATSSANYAGRSGFVGEDQINFQVPAGLSGCYVPVTVVMNGVVGNFGSISVDPAGGVCSDPYGLTPTQISQAASGQLSVASILLTRLSLQAGLTLTEDAANGRFYQFNGPGASPLNNVDVFGISSYGSCAVSNCANTSTCVPTSKGLAAIPKLNAGSALSISGNGAPTTSIPLDSSGDGFYTANLASSPLALPGFTVVDNFLKPGPFTVAGTGGTDVPAFSVNITVPAAVTLTTSPAVSATGTLDRSQPLTFTFPSGLTGWVLLSASSATNVNTIPAGQYNATTITCLQQASAGSFTIPSYLLEALPVAADLTVAGIPLPTGAVLIAPFDLSHTFTSGATVSFANAIVSSGTNTNVK